MKKVIKIGAEWCGPCKMLAPIFHKVEQMEEFKDVEFKSLDVEDDEAEDLAVKYQIRNVPTILLFDENNELITKQVGAMPEPMFIQFLKENLGK